VIDARLNEAFAFHQQGRLSEAESLYLGLLEEAPGHGWVLHMLGVLHWQRGRYASAVDLLRRAVAIEPESAAVHSNLGLALHAIGEFDAALASCDRALAFQPAYAEALFNRGNSLRAMGRSGDALESYERALAIRPEYVEALFNRGQVLEELRRFAEAAASYERVVALRPEYADARYQLGNALRGMGKQREAVARYDETLALRPSHAEALNNRGNALLALGRWQDALASYDAAVAFAPTLAAAHNNRGNVLRDLGRYDEALAACDAAVRLDNEMVEAFNNRGNVLREMGRADEALASYERALELAPDFAEAHNNRGNALVDLGRPAEALASYERAIGLRPTASAFNDRGRALLGMYRFSDALRDFDRALELDSTNADALSNRGAALWGLKRYDEAARSYARLIETTPSYDYAEGNLLSCLLSGCDWTDVPAHIRRIDEAVRSGERAIAPFYYTVISKSPADQLQCAKIYAAQASATLASRRGPVHGHGRIRVAYLSADLHDHAIGYLTAGLFEAHDRSRFEITGISLGPDVDGPMRSRLRRAFDRFVDARAMSDRSVAEWMKEQEIDIAVDLNGYTQGARCGILNLRPAPVQVNYLGYPGTMGNASIDYIVADRNLIASTEEIYYSEKVVRLPETYQVNDVKRAIAEHTPSRAELGLPDNAFVFCCFNNNYKIMPEIFAIWMRLLAAVPGSVLWLLQDTPIAASNLRREAQQRGLAPDRLVFAPRKKHDEHLARQRRADLFLDTLPYNAHTTASDALWVGLPLLTCVGATFAGRVAGSLLHAAGLSALVTQSLGDYEALALKLATTPTLLASIRTELERQRSHCPLFDTDRFRRHLESAFIAMHARAKRGEAPASFAVSPVDANENGVR